MVEVERFAIAEQAKGAGNGPFVFLEQYNFHYALNIEN
jgi:hypothetical protein